MTALESIAARNAALHAEILASLADAERLWTEAGDDRRTDALILLARLRYMRADNESLSRLLEAMK